MGKLESYVYKDEHDQIIYDDKQTIYWSIVNNRYSVQSTTGDISIHCPGCGINPYEENER